MAVALYDPDGGFYASGGGAGRTGRDFVTSPEVGSLFGALVARAVDGWWREMDEPDPFVVVEAGAGRGRLARDVLAAPPACATALRYVLVETSEVLREQQVELVALEPAGEVLGPVVDDEDPDEPPVVVPGLGPIVTSLADLPAGPVRGVVVANELLDNLSFGIAEMTTHGWCDVRVTVDNEAFREVLVPAREPVGHLPDDAPVGTRVPVLTGVDAWLRRAAAMLRVGWIVVVDYGADLDDLAARGGWLRTYAGHTRGDDPLATPGSCDITTDIPFDVVRRMAERAGLVVDAETIQGEWLRSLGIDELVDEARAVWTARAAIGDLPALAARSRVSEAEALLDPAGLGAHRVLILRKS